VKTMNVLVRGVGVLSSVLIVLASMSWVSSGWGDCDDKGARSVGCGSGGNNCVGNDYDTCTDDDAKTLASGLFECGYVANRWGCITSDRVQALCYIEYDVCHYDEDHYPRCYYNDDEGDRHFDWIKVDESCPSM